MDDETRKVFKEWLMEAIKNEQNPQKIEAYMKSITAIEQMELEKSKNDKENFREFLRIFANLGISIGTTIVGVLTLNGAAIMGYKVEKEALLASSVPMKLALKMLNDVGIKALFNKH